MMKNNCSNGLKNSESHRLLAIDFSRAFAIILVVIGHWSLGGWEPRWWSVSVDVIYTFHMPLFMAMSGYLYIFGRNRKTASYFDFLLGKVRRLMIPYIATSIIISIKSVSQLLGAYVENPVTLKTYIEILYSPSAGYFLWFIWALWWMFVLVPFFKTRNSRTILFIASVIFSLIPIELPELFCLWQTKQMLPYFMTGVILCDWKDYLSLKNTAVRILSALLFVGFEVLYLLGFYGVDLIVPYIAIIAILAITSYMENHIERRVSKALLYVSSASYIIYLFHTTFEGFVKSIIIKSGVVMNDWIFLACAIVGVIVGVWMPLLLYRFVLGRWKVTSFLFGLKLVENQRRKEDRENN